ncbi:hypothetical protein [Hahella sp. HN01]|uniref:hypothetical protein n=1 Tax=Hahella sp. HN01 TaxID=2847262 RepID=UPI001C1EC06B|nr:hypothetical protein [Hahella sp. HN01]MBU6955918.1 hypothetical protein [Hahella sp. HN01]
MPIQANNFVFQGANDIPQLPQLNNRQAMRRFQASTQTIVNNGIYVPQQGYVIVSRTDRAIAANRRYLYTNSVNPCVAVYVLVKYNGDNDLVALAHFDSDAIEVQNCLVGRVFPALVEKMHIMLKRRFAAVGNTYVQTLFGINPNNTSRQIRDSIRNTCQQNNYVISPNPVFNGPNNGLRAFQSTAMACDLRNGTHRIMSENAINIQDDVEEQRNQAYAQQGILIAGRLTTSLA